jgi:hypothetical protein
VHAFDKVASGPPYGTVSSFDGKRGQVLHRHTHDEDSSQHPSLDEQVLFNDLKPYRSRFC